MRVTASPPLSAAPNGFDDEIKKIKNKNRWVFWAFHLNTNQKDARAHAGVREDSRGHTFPAKVSPPFLKRRVGVFSTRTPHRPNPIGVSLCKVWEGVEHSNTQETAGLCAVRIFDDFLGQPSESLMSSPK